jgi:3-keto-5-aminohexanoate cleavage enzyme
MKIKKIINFAPNGTQTTKENSFAPFTPDEIIEEVHQAYELGITLTHIHARDPNDLTNTYKKEIYQKIIAGIRKHCPELAICVSLTGRQCPEFEKRSEVLELYPDMGSLTMSSLNFPKGESINPPEMILKLIQKMNNYGVTPEIECFDSGMLNYANHLINKKILESPSYINVILGNMYNAQTDIASINSIVNNKPVNSRMCFGGIGKDQLKSNILGLLYSDGIRIGLEDNLYYKNKEKTTNIDLLKRIQRIMHELDFDIIKPKEFKKMGYANKKINHTR